MNDISEALDNKQCCLSLFIDFSKAFDTVDHDILTKRLAAVEFSVHAVGWIANYLIDRTHAVQLEGATSEVLVVHKGVPQGSVLGPLLFTLYINSIGVNIPNTSFHFYADDTVIYCSAPTPEKAFVYLQNAFDKVQEQLCQLQLVLNADKTKLMFFTNSNSARSKLSNVIVASNGQQIELVSTFKYLGFLIDEHLSFKDHILYTVKKLKLLLGFYFRNKSCFSFAVKQKLVESTFLPILDYGDVLYMSATAHCLHMLDSVYHGALRFITNCGALTHHCVLYAKVNWPSLYAHRLGHWYVLIYKAILGLTPSYLSSLLVMKDGAYNLRSQDFVHFTVPKVRTEMGKKAFRFAAPSSWLELQSELKLLSLVSLNIFKSLMSPIVSRLHECKCFI